MIACDVVRLSAARIVAMNLHKEQRMNDDK
jgi:hypothetical protein